MPGEVGSVGSGRGREGSVWVWVWVYEEHGNFELKVYGEEERNWDDVKVKLLCWGEEEQANVSTRGIRISDWRD